MRTLYPEIEPYSAQVLPVDEVHQIYLEECGNPEGIPVVFLHGGPGSGCKPHQRRFFDPVYYRVVLFDQRGCGRSLPNGELAANTTDHLLQDLERIRLTLGVQRWLLHGGSWGAALALLYAQRHPERVSGMILRGTFLARAQDLSWYAGAGVNRIYPERWQQLLELISEAERDDLIGALHRHLQGPDELARHRAARAWEQWGSTVTLGGEGALETPDQHVTLRLLNQARLELHYAVNRYFIGENQILDNCHRCRHIPAIIIHGRRDLVCPMESAYSLWQCLPEAEFIPLAEAGHIAEGEPMIDALVTATDRMARRLAQ